MLLKILFKSGFDFFKVIEELIKKEVLEVKYFKLYNALCCALTYLGSFDQSRQPFLKNLQMLWPSFAWSIQILKVRNTQCFCWSHNTEKTEVCTESPGRWMGILNSTAVCKSPINFNMGSLYSVLFWNRNNIL